MRVVMLYKPQSDHRRLVEEYASEFTRRGYGQLELVDCDSQAGVTMADLYQIMDRPALLIIDDQSRLSAFWQGETLPLYDEILGYIHA